MYIIDNAKKLQNKTIAYSSSDIDETIIVTKDGGILYMIYDDDVEYITDLNKCIVTLNGYSAVSMLIEEGIISRLEVDEILEEKRKITKAKRDIFEKQELRELARLKAKYENNNNLPI